MELMVSARADADADSAYDRNMTSMQRFLRGLSGRKVVHEAKFESPLTSDCTGLSVKIWCTRKLVHEINPMGHILLL